MEQYARIIRECFWDSRIEAEELKRVLMKGSRREKRQLFERILLNSSRYLLDLRLFGSEELRGLLEEYRIPDFNREYAFRRKNIAELYFFDKKLEIPELQWTEV